MPPRGSGGSPLSISSGEGAEGGAEGGAAAGGGASCSSSADERPGESTDWVASTPARRIAAARGVGVPRKGLPPSA